MKPVLVTGGAKGLGAEICLHLAQNGHDVVIHYRQSEKQAHALAEKCRSYKVNAETIFGDFSSVESVEKFIAAYTQRFSETKGLVNNVGNYLIAPSVDTHIHQWLDLFQTNFFTPIILTQALLPSLRKQKGSIVNIGTVALESNRGFTQSPAYAASKAALLFYTVSLAKELAHDFIRVNMISPGYMENAVDLKEAKDLPLKRPAYLQEVAQFVVSLFDPKNAYITGQNIEIAGGVGL